jgi:hypothetical protein
MIFPNVTERNLFPLEAFMMRVSIAFLVFDTILGVIYKFNDLNLFLHHTIMASVFVYALYR